MSVPLNAVKQTFDLEEYSLSQATLEQVSFLQTREHHPDKLRVNLPVHPSLRKTLTLLFPYLFSPTQVFLEFSKEQELGNLDDEVDATVRWKLLPQEEP